MAFLPWQEKSDKSFSPRKKFLFSVSRPDALRSRAFEKIVFVVTLPLRNIVSPPLSYLFYAISETTFFPGLLCAKSKSERRFPKAPLCKGSCHAQHRLRDCPALMPRFPIETDKPMAYPFRHSVPPPLCQKGEA